jgi:hypothetical protein
MPQAAGGQQPGAGGVSPQGGAQAARQQAKATGWSLRRKLVTIIMNRVLRAPKKVRVAELQQRFNAHAEKIIEVHITDQDVFYYLRVKDGTVQQIQPVLRCPCGKQQPAVDRVIPLAVCGHCATRISTVPRPEEVAGGVHTTADVLISLWRGKQKVANPVTGRMEWEAYAPMDAVSLGDADVWGDASSNDLLLFKQLFAQFSHVILGDQAQAEEEAARAPQDPEAGPVEGEGATS